MIEALGTIAHSGTKAFLDKIQATQTGDGASLWSVCIGFYSAFMVAERVDVFSRRGGARSLAMVIGSKGCVFPGGRDTRGGASIRGTRVVLHLAENAASYTGRVRSRADRWKRAICRQRAGAHPNHREARCRAPGGGRWGRPLDKTKIRYFRGRLHRFLPNLAGQFDEPALTVHFRAEGRHEYTALAFVPGSPPFDLFDADRKGRIKLYVKRVFITDEVEVLPRYLRFVRGLLDSADLPLNISRETIQESPVLAAIKKGLTSRLLGDLEKLAENEPEHYAKIWDNFGAALKEGIYDDFERRDALLALARFRTTTSTSTWRSLKEYVGLLKENQTSIYYHTGDDITRLEASPHLEGFRARGVEVLLLSDPVDSFWAGTGVSFDGKPFKSVTQGTADLELIPNVDAKHEPTSDVDKAVTGFVAFIKDSLGDVVSDVRVSERLTDSAVCLIAPEAGPDRQLEKMLIGAGRLKLPQNRYWR